MVDLHVLVFEHSKVEGISEEFLFLRVRLIRGCVVLEEMLGITGHILCIFNLLVFVSAVIDRSFVHPWIPSHIHLNLRRNLQGKTRSYVSYK